MNLGTWKKISTHFSFEKSVSFLYDTKIIMDKKTSCLRKNFKILSELNAKGKTKVVRNTLNSHNFDFSLFTSIYTTKTGNVYYYVYNQGYLELDNDYFLLIKKD